MDWCRTVDQNSIEVSSLKNNEGIHITTKRITPSHEEATQELSLVSQFIIAPFKFVSPKNHTILPLGKEVLSLVQEQILPHFDRCIEFYENNELVSISIRELKHLSMIRFNNIYESNMLHPLILDIYRNADVFCESDIDNSILYEIDIELLVGGEIQETSFEGFIKNTYLKAEGHITIIPFGWRFDDQLKQSLYLNFLGTICKRIYLYVSSDHKRVRAVMGVK